MPYTIRKRKCKQSDGDRGGWVLSYVDKSGKKHRNCHTSRKKAKAQIAAIEIGESATELGSPTLVEVIRELVRQHLLEAATHDEP